MGNYDEIFDKEKIEKIYGSGEVKPLEDMCEIEGVALDINDMMHKIAFYEEYKKKKVKDVNKAIKGISNQIEFYKQVILKTLQENKQKGLSFPGTCRISSRKGRDKWIISDEDDFIEFLKKEKELDRVAEKMTQYNIIKTEANRLLDSLVETDKIPKCVTQEKGKPSVSIAFVKEEETEEIFEEKVPVKENYDKLGF